ncbi:MULTISPECIES: VCBS repeat-containing protein [unclassified Microbacterium]|uniref:FG-GAP repeat domain-containing protein n=1 Tax=unclassified Microbacterium TaxID=2609290 RepID=UPI00191EC2ED|nr:MULTISPECIES: VCBS repeat-containing protein [unclassified Microbacterium]QYM64298.1 VCBS repeat-containing protein [Microbacterium sp. Se5.02b]
MTLRWRKEFIAAESFESAAFVDVDGDGVLDIVSGSFWYRGPDFIERTLFAPDARHGEYHDDFGSVAIDLTGDGRPDIVTGGWWGNELRWRENTAAAGEDRLWPEHLIARPGAIEQPSAWDVDGDGVPELVPNTPGDPLVVYKRDGQRWSAGVVSGLAQGHGLGFGDISGNGRGDLVVNYGWFENAGPDAEWLLHRDFDLGKDASVPILVTDVDGDGLNDLIVGHGHGYGLDWWQQRLHPDGRREWIRHVIDPAVSQCHTLRWADIDGDGVDELVTGKRWRAHPTGDPGNEDDLGIWYYKWADGAFVKHTVDAGPPGFGSGVGIDFDLADLDGNGYLDLVAPGKDGLWLFRNLGPAPL